MKYTTNNTKDDCEVGFVMAIPDENWTPGGWVEGKGQRVDVYSEYFELFKSLGGNIDQANDMRDPRFTIPHLTDNSDYETIGSLDLTDESGSDMIWMARCGIPTGNLKLCSTYD